MEASKIQVATAAATAAAVPAVAPMVSSSGALKPASVDTK